MRPRDHRCQKANPSLESEEQKKQQVLPGLLGNSWTMAEAPGRKGEQNKSTQTAGHVAPPPDHGGSTGTARDAT